jgi:hypothetical protein
MADQRRFPPPWRTALGNASYLLFLVGAGAFGLSVALAMLISEDDQFAAMLIVASVAGVAIFVGARKYRARTRAVSLSVLPPIDPTVRSPPVPPPT